jgi:2-haloacid dehalogenase
LVHGDRAMSPGEVEILTFDCYGTLVDWEQGLADGLETILRPHGVEATRERLLARFAHYEERAEAGEYITYRELLATVADSIAAEDGVTLSSRERGHLADSLPEWPVFTDTVPALEKLAGRYRLGILSNIDDDLFAATARRLVVRFDPVVTAQQIGSYKPAQRNFDVLLERVGVVPARLLHVAQSLFHDIAPASALGLRTVWVDRRRGQPGGATPHGDAVPDCRVASLAALADMLYG